MPFGFESFWDDGIAKEFVADVVLSPMPFGFESFWDKASVNPHFKSRYGLQCLSALSPFGTL